MLSGLLSLDDVKDFKRRGDELCETGQLKEALNFYLKVLKVQQQLGQDNLEVAESCHKIGIIYHSLDNPVKALDYSSRALKIRQERAPDSLELAESYNDIGVIYCSLDVPESALKSFEKALEIRKIQAPVSIETAESYYNIARLYQLQGEMIQSHNHYCKFLTIKANIAPNLELAESYHNEALFYQSQNKLKTAYRHFHNSLVLKKLLAPDNLDKLALSYKALGLICGLLNMQQEALNYFAECLSLQENLSDNLGASNLHHNIAMIYESVGQVRDAIIHYEESLKIKEGLLAPNHPELIILRIIIANAQLFIAEYDLALISIEICLQQDPENKYAHHIKGLILQKQAALIPVGQDKTDKLNQSLKEFEEALGLDDKYADARLYKIAVKIDLALLETTEANKDRMLRQIRAEINEALDLEKSDEYDLRKKAQYDQIAQTTIGFPKPEFEAQSLKYQNKINGLLRRITVSHDPIDEVEVRRENVVGQSASSSAAVRPNSNNPNPDKGGAKNSKIARRPSNSAVNPVSIPRSCCAVM